MSFYCGVSRGEEHRLQTELWMIWICDAFVCTLKRQLES